MRLSEVLTLLACLLLMAACSQDDGPSGDSEIGGQSRPMVLAAGWQTTTTWPAETVVALNSVNMRSTSYVEGDVGVISAAGGAVLNGTQELYVATNAEIKGNVRANGLQMESGGHIFGTAAYNSIVGTGTIDGTKTTSLAIPVPIKVVTTSNFAAGSTNIAVAASGSSTANGGSYNAITLTAGTRASPTVLTLSAGTYNIGSLTLGNYSRVECKGTVVLRVKTRVSAGQFSYIGPSVAAATYTYGTISLFVEGTNGTAVPNGTPAALAMGANSELKALTFVPNGTLSLGTSSSGVGKFIAKDVDIGSDTELMTGSTAQRMLQTRYVVGPTWPDSVITAWNSIDLQASTTVTGNVAVISDATTYLNGAEAPLGTSAKITGTLSADKVTLASGAQVLGQTTFNSFTNSGGTFGGGTSTPLALPQYIRVPVFPVITSNNTNYTVGSTAKVTLAAGRWKVMTLTAGLATNYTVVTLSGGVYEMNRLVMNNYTQIICNAACEIRIKDRINPGTAVKIGPAAGLDISNVKVFIYRDDSLSPSTPYAAQFLAGSNISAFMFAPYGMMDFGSGSTLNGRFIAESIRLGSSTTDTRAGTTEIAPTIQTQPVSQSLIVGQSATFSVVASGTNITFQWKRNGTAISGATTGTYTIPSVALTDNSASFTVTVSNTVGGVPTSVTSSAAVLTVTACNSMSNPPTATTCGVGACASTGMSSCVGGALVDTCVAGSPAASDTSCNNSDDDCNGLVDDGYVPVTTTCAAGACAATGITSCVGGVVRDSCTGSTPSSTDTTCDGRDDNCNGTTDEGYVGMSTSCGVGVCASTGSTSCSAGAVFDSCTPGSPTRTLDDNCNNVDEDCSGENDEDYDPVSTHCGTGACKADGLTDCVNGAITDSCTPGFNSATDKTCDGVDDDCNGTNDDGYVSLTTSCGVGACVRSGSTSCISGTVADSCVPGTPGSSDTTCNNVDENCNGTKDEGYVSTVTSCGTGACLRSGSTSCVSGSVVNNCTPGTPAASDTTCDGVDDNCNGTKDEGYVSLVTNCGVGACARTGSTSCVNGVVVNSCTPGTPAASDTTCNNVDDNCNGTKDEGYVSVATNCGTGACARTGSTSCVSGSVADSCAPGTPSPSDTSCNNIDDNCNGTKDEGYVSITSSCGVGACARNGTTSCSGGTVLDTCSPGAPGASDTTCDGVDDNCNGTKDEGYVSTASSCGIGACARTGSTSCVSGSVSSGCTPGTPAASDVTCDNVDDNCNGSKDEGYVSVTTSCGVGACTRSGSTSCSAGSVTDNCAPGAPGASDTTCNSIDEDCNGAADDGYVSVATSCGTGTCTRSGATSCSSGSVLDSCVVPSADADSDGTADCADGCPADPAKTAPGVCGCSVSDVDSDSDGTSDCNDVCPLDPQNDVDNDSVCGNVDNCPTTANSDQADNDGDLIGDVCDQPSGSGIAAGGQHSCLLLGDQTINCWGTNDSGQLGNGSTSFSARPVVVSGIADAQQLVVGYAHSCTLRADHTVSCWGANDVGQLGDHSNSARNTPVAVTGLSNVAQIAAGHDHTCALKTDHTVSCWGGNATGQLGNGTSTDSNAVVSVSGITDAVQIGSGYGHSCALRSTGSVVCWGANWYGELGNGTTTGNINFGDNVGNNVPVAVSGLSNVSSIGLGGLHSCAVVSGAVKCWGANWNGELGNNTTADSSTPVSVSGLSGVASVSGGLLHTCALKTNGSLTCWGYNSFGQLGNDSYVDSATPVTVSGISNVVDFSEGDNHTCAIASNGDIMCWGDASGGQLGATAVELVSTPTAVVGVANAQQVSPGAAHVCALLSSGNVNCWGYNAYGQLGDGTTNLATVPHAVSGLSNVTAISSGAVHVCALRSTKDVRCWGQGSDGQLGNGASPSSPVTTSVAVSGINTATAVAAGGYHSCALLTDRTVRCWGRGTSGQLGNSGTTSSNTPVTVSGLSDAVAIATGSTHTCAVRATGAVVCWGLGGEGQLGNGVFANASSPVAVSGITDATAVVAGGAYSCALHADATISCWGRGKDSQLGNGAKLNSSLPVAVTGISSAIGLGGGTTHVCAVLAANSVTCWGDNAAGQLGDGSTTSSSTPVVAGGVFDALRVAGGLHASCVVRSTGTLSCWGTNEFGELANGYPSTAVPIFVSW